MNFERKNEIFHDIFKLVFRSIIVVTLNERDPVAWLSLIQTGLSVYVYFMCI